MDQADYYHLRWRYYYKVLHLGLKESFKKAQEDVAVWLKKKNK